MKCSTRISRLLAAGSVVLLLAGPLAAFEIPQPLKAAHHELYDRLEQATRAGGDTSEAARNAMGALRGHFEKEERYALPQLGALPALARMPGQTHAALTPAQRQDLIARTERFRSELPQMLEEHEAISAALKKLEQAAQREQKPEVARLAQEIMAHAKTEELVLYPAALLLGEYIKTGGSPQRRAEYRPPEPLPEELTQQQQRSMLESLRANLCESLELEAGVIINTGILPKVPSRIQEMTGIPIHELEARETRACSRDPAEMSMADLRHNVRTLEWLARVHLVAMRDATLEDPRLRPVNAQGIFADIFQLHDKIVLAMRERVKQFTDQPSVEHAQALNRFWHEVVQPHAQAEDRIVWALAEKQADAGVGKAARLLEEEHRRIDQMIAEFDGQLTKVGRGQAGVDTLVPLARGIWRRTELHFGKEEESVYRPLQDQLSAEEFRPIIEQQNRAVGDWLRQQGWSMTR